MVDTARCLVLCVRVAASCLYLKLAIMSYWCWLLFVVLIVACCCLLFSSCELRHFVGCSWLSLLLSAVAFRFLLGGGVCFCCMCYLLCCCFSVFI